MAFVLHNGEKLFSLSLRQKATLNWAGEKIVGGITIATADETTDGSILVKKLQQHKFYSL